MAQRRPSVGGSDSRGRRRNAAQQGAHGGGAQGPKGQHPDASVFRCARLPPCLEGALQGTSTSRMGRWVCVEIAVSAAAGQCRPVQAGAVQPPFPSFRGDQQRSGRTKS